MTLAKRWNSRMIAVVGLVLTAGLLVVLGHRDGGEVREALAAQPSRQAPNKAQARQAFDRIIRSLQGVDTAYASGNAAEAQAKFDQAKSDWNVVAPAISTREAREVQLLFDSLGDQLKNNAPASKVSATLEGMLGELHEDIQGELGGERPGRGRSERKEHDED